MPALRFTALLPLVLVLLAGCKSADELYNEGQDLELLGRYEAASLRYAAALEKQPNLQKARGRLFEAGRLAVGGYRTQIAEAEAAGRWVEAGDLHHRLDALVGRARNVGVMLPLPEDYAEQRRANFEAAITTLLNEGTADVERGRFAAALERFERARRYEPTRADLDALTDAAADAYYAWAEADLAAGHFRAAHARAEAALALTGPTSEAGRGLLALRDEALARGSVRVAFLPVRQRTAAESRLPHGFLTDLNDGLGYDHWSRPPLFVLVADPGLVRRMLRERGPSSGPISPSEAARLGRALDAHLAFTGVVGRFRRDVEEKERTEVAARTHGGERVTYLRIEEEVTLSATVAFDVVDVRARRSVCEREVERSVRDRFARGEYGGSLRTLDISRDARLLFDADALAERERGLEADLAGALAERIAELAFECLLRQVR